ncbi:MAG: hypothetical protein FJ126_13515 [Deltaproteobacteria bacterium]|nr:hypothetical protein [Deltaproteobacteria bacterium]
MNKRVFIIVLIVLLAIPAAALALTEAEIKARTHIVNLEAEPEWFRPGQPINFIVTLRYDGGAHGGFDVGVFHEGRLVGWEMNKRLNTGMNTFRLHDPHFQGDPGAYIVKVRFNGKVFTQKKFGTKRACKFTINPKAAVPW